MPKRLKEYDQKTLADALRDCPTPFLLHFGTDWCTPCRKLERVLLELAEDWQETIRLGKINVEDELQLAAAYGVTRNPTLCLVQDENLVRRLEGFHSHSDVTAFVTGSS